MQAPHKFSSVERRLNYFLGFFFAFLLVACSIAAAASNLYGPASRIFWPLDLDTEAPYVFFACIIIYN
jgi:hypothetical protein